MSLNVAREASGKSWPVEYDIGREQWFGVQGGPGQTGPSRGRGGLPRGRAGCEAVPEAGPSLPEPPAVAARWDAQGVVSGVPGVEGTGPAGPVSRPSLPRASLFRLRSQELTAGWLRAFCRSPTFWPSSIVTWSTLRLFEGSEAARRGGTESQEGARLGAKGGQAAPTQGAAPSAHLQHAGVQVGEGVDVHGDVGLGQALQVLQGGTAWGRNW